MTLILGLAGRACHGKTTAANAIQQYVKQNAFCRENNPRNDDCGIYDIGGLVLQYCIANKLLPNKKRSDLTDGEKEVLVNVGKAQREFRESFWIDQIFQKIADDNFDVAIIPNVRYLNEAQRVKSAGGHVIRVRSLNPDGSEYISPDRPANHPSETELHSYNADYFILARRGEDRLVSEQAVTLFSYLWGLKKNARD
ncbi:MAG: hypothetical protein JWQ87_2026 [Candidatus Sulfotelmatobacter sp.]|nr:hypothetical protein [Candidatus Sulfotelmatobacter sp.]